MFEIIIEMYYLNFKYLIAILFNIKNKNAKFHFNIINIVKNSFQF